jgi:hypothetical protein
MNENEKARGAAAAVEAAIMRSVLRDKAVFLTADGDPEKLNALRDGLYAESHDSAICVEIAGRSYDEYLGLCDDGNPWCVYLSLK